MYHTIFHIIENILLILLVTRLTDRFWEHMDESVPNTFIVQDILLFHYLVPLCSTVKLFHI